MRIALPLSLLLALTACGDDDAAMDAASDVPAADVPAADVPDPMDVPVVDAPVADAPESDAPVVDAPGIDAFGCIMEGESAAVIPEMPPCCGDLVFVGCSEPEGDTCSLCAGASFCTACGDGECGLGENVCRCPADCS